MRAKAQALAVCPETQTHRSVLFGFIKRHPVTPIANPQQMTFHCRDTLGPGGVKRSNSEEMQRWQDLSHT